MSTVDTDNWLKAEICNFNRVGIFLSSLLSLSRCSGQRVCFWSSLGRLQGWHSGRSWDLGVGGCCLCVGAIIIAMSLDKPHCKRDCGCSDTILGG